MSAPAATLRFGRGPLDPLRAVVAGGVRRALGGSEEEIAAYRTPLGDEGLFGPDSIAWRVHADLPAMLIGGFSALLLQTLHPLPMAAVADHSRFREDFDGRLQRTAHFIAGTTFGGTELAEELLGEVRQVHARVRGVAPDGRPYSADDPALLTFVHTAEVWSFLRSYQRYSSRPLFAEEKNRYLGEMTVIAERLGATEVPASVTEVRRYFRGIEGELALTPAASEAVRFLLALPDGAAAELMGHEVVANAAVELLPGFARRLLGFSPLRVATAPAVRVGAATFAYFLRWSVGPSVVAAISEARARGRRAGKGPALGTMECQSPRSG